MNVVVKQITDPVPHILDVKPDVPPDIEIIIEKAMAKDRYERFQDVKSLANALNAVARGESLSLGSSDSTIVASSKTVLATSRPIQPIPGAETEIIKSSPPEPAPPKKTSRTRYLWIPISLIIVLCVFALAFGVAALIFMPGSLSALPFLNTRTPVPTKVIASPTSLPTFTSTPDFTVSIGLNGLLLYSGPGEYYPQKPSSLAM